MKLYELTIIFNPTLDESAIQSEIEKIEKQISGSGGQIEKIDRWGTKRMTYKIRGHHQGLYVFFLFKAKPGLSSEIERSLRLNENVLRFLTILSPGTVAVKPVKTGFEDDQVQFDEYTNQQE
jgi:small subunit ribosomal protein S6